MSFDVVIISNVNINIILINVSLLTYQKYINLFTKSEAKKKY